MLSRILVGVVSTAGAVAIGFPGAAWADPEPAPSPPPPNVNALPPISPVDYAVMGDRYYAFATPDGLTCAFERTNGSYGCSGPIPAAPGGANLVSGGPWGEPGFASTGAPVFGALGPVKPLPVNTRLSFRNISCGVDAAGSTTCTNSADQSGFVLTPAGSYTFGGVNPLVDRPQGANPFAN
ncbi:hypothetical protein BH09ACT7_BH09ACT7_25000 [soil metagenome]